MRYFTNICSRCNKCLTNLHFSLKIGRLYPEDPLRQVGLPRGPGAEACRKNIAGILWALPLHHMKVPKLSVPDPLRQLHGMGLQIIPVPAG